ncbi:MAG: hypothetical protein ABSA63_02145 [Thermoplasmata archaeon]|jgi:hypothetical protein
MGFAGGSRDVAQSSSPLSDSSIEGIGIHLSTAAGRIDLAARRSRRFSWYCWGFLFGTYAGLLVFSILANLFQVVTTTTTSQGVSVTTTYPWWDLPVSAAIPVALLLLAVREVVLGRRELRMPPTSTGTSELTLGWTEAVQQCQRKITHAKSETEWSFVPLVLGLFSLTEVCVFILFDFISPTGTSTILIAPVVGFGSLALLWPLYRAARKWIGSYQRLLDRQVGELARLEAEFLWRFAGAPPTA